MRNVEAFGPRKLLAGIAMLALALLGQGGCSSDGYPPLSAGGNASQAGTSPASAGSATAGGGGNASGAGGTGNTDAGTSAVSGGSAGASAGGASTAGMTSAGGAVGVAGASTAGSSTGGAAGNTGGAGTGGSVGNGTKPIKVWIAGDSTVQNCSSACPCGWGSQFDPLFNDNVTVVNSAVGGRSIQTWLYEASVSSTLGGNGECTLTSQNYDKRWTAMLDANTGMKAGDYLFIQFGINDSDSACPKHVGSPLFKTLLTTMAQAAKDRGALPVFVTPVSAIICKGSVAQPTRGHFVDDTKAAATAAGVPLLDLHQLSIDLYNKLGFCPNDENYGAGKLGDFFCQDHTHFETAGAKQIAALVASALPTAGPSLAPYLK